MNLNKSTRYALYAAMEMARGESQVTVVQVATRYRIPETVLAKVFQQLVRSGIAIGTRGTGGGYRLVRPSSTVTVLDVLNAFEPYRSPDQCLLADRTEAECADFSLCRLRSLFDEVDEQARATFASVSLETLVGRAAGGDEADRIIDEAS
jgi:Rrf2 family protein